MESLNILALTSWYPSDADPFLGNFVKRHCEALSIHHKVWVVYVAAAEKKSDERAVETKTGTLTEIVVYAKLGKSGPVKFLQRRNAINKIVNRLKVRFDILHAHAAFPLAPIFSSVARKLNIPWVFSEHWNGYHDANRPPVNPLKWNWIMKAAGTAELGFPVSESLAEAMKKVVPGLELICVANVVEDVFFNTHKSSNRKEKVRFLHVSTLVEKFKNFRGTLEAFASLRESGYAFELIVISDGDSSDAENWTRELKLSDQVRFRGPRSPKEIAEEMSVSDALVLFSNTENQPCVVLEALSSGLPVIASSVGDIPNLVTEGKGFVVPPRDIDALTESLIRFIENRSQYDPDQVAANTHEKFSKEAVALAYSKAYEKVLNP